MSEEKAPLVGREREVATIATALELIASERPAIIGIAGEPGIGKTRLLTELSERAEGAGHLVLAGSASEFERQLPYSVFVDALDEHLAEFDPSRLQMRGVENVDRLATIFPALAEPATGSEQPPIERHEAHRAIAGLLSGLAATRGLVLVVDDMHWADEASIELLLALNRRPPEGGVLLAAAYRPQESVAGLNDALLAHERGGRRFVIQPKPLASEEAAELIPDELPEPLRIALLNAAAGNPLYLELLMRTPATLTGSTPSGSEEVTVLEGGFRLPGAIAASLAEELRGLEPDTIALLEAAAVAGEPFRLGLAAEIAELDQGRARELIDEAMRARIVVSAQPPGHFAFRHPLIRRAVYAGSGEGWRIAAHGRAATVLAAQGADPAARAHHVARSAEPGDAEAIELLREAAALTMTRAPLSSAHWLRTALGLVPHADVDQRRRMLAELARALLTGGHLEEAQEVMDEAIGLSGADVDPQLFIDLAEIDQWQGRTWAAISRLEKIGASEVAELPGVRAKIELRLLYLERWNGGIEKALAHGQAALEAAEADGDEAVLAGVGAAFAEVASNVDVASATVQYESTVEAVRKLGNDELETVLDALYSLGWAAVHLERFDEAVEHFRRGLEIARRAASVRHLYTLRAEPAEALIRAGRVAEALAQAEDAVEAARLHPSPRYLWWSLWIQSAALSRAGEQESAEAAFAEAEEVGKQLDPQPLYDIWMGYQRAALLSGADKHQEAVAALYESCGGEELAMIPIADRHSAWEIETRAALAAGDLDRAEAIVSGAERAAGGFGLPNLEGVSARCRALLCEAQGDYEGTVTAAARAIELAEASHARVDAERSRMLCARALMALNRKDEAATQFALAEENLSRVGAEAHRSTAARQMRKLGRRTRRRPAAASVAPEGTGELGSLSDREREVADLVAEDLTNRAIAERLFLSEKTVESHLRNVFAKLNVSSRVAVAIAVERERTAG